MASLSIGRCWSLLTSQVALCRYMEHGALNSYLQKGGERMLEVERLLMARDCAYGLAYLSKRGFVFVVSKKTVFSRGDELWRLWKL